MTRSIWFLLRTDRVRRNVVSVKRRLLRLRVEALERREMLHAGPHGGAGTLFDEHLAVMELINFAEIHSPVDDQGQSKTNFTATTFYYQAQDGDSDPATPNFWSDPNNWVKLMYDPVSGDFLPPVCPDAATDCPTADHIPTTGDDVEIPEGLELIYDLGPDAFNQPPAAPAGAASAASAGSLSFKNNLRLHTVAARGSLSFQENSELLMFFETLVVAPSGSLTINDTNPNTSVRLV